MSLRIGEVSLYPVCRGTRSVAVLGIAALWMLPLAGCQTWGVAEARPQNDAKKPKVIRPFGESVKPKKNWFIGKWSARRPGQTIPVGMGTINEVITLNANGTGSNSVGPFRWKSRGKDTLGITYINDDPVPTTAEWHLKWRLYIPKTVSNEAEHVYDAMSVTVDDGSSMPTVTYYRPHK